MAHFVFTPLYGVNLYQYGNNVESSSKLYMRINQLYKRALEEQLNVSDQQKIDDDNVINRNKFPLNKLLYTVQSLETFSFLEGRNSLDGKDILGDFFESITRDGFKQNKGQFFTPTPIVNFILYALKLDELAIDRLNEDRELPLIIDPSAGSGTYLVEAMKMVTKEVKYKQLSRVKSSRQIKQRFEDLFKPDYNENKWAREYLYGCEINFDLGTASKVNMILHGDGSTNIFVKDGLLPFRLYVKESGQNSLDSSILEPLYNDKEINGKFDVVISNPPFNVDLDTQTQREVKNAFLFGDKKNSENLFIERYYQLLKERGRLGVVLPESIFDTAENKYIRLFLFKYFHIKAVISLPQITFEPFTSTKTSLLFAQKKSREEVSNWNELWTKYGQEWSLLKTRINDYIKYFVEGKKLNKRWAKDVVEDIENNNSDNILKNIKRFLKDYISPEDEELVIKDLLVKYTKELQNLLKYEKETNAFGFCNAWWIFGEVVKETNIDYSIFMAEADNVGYKRTKRGEKTMPNDLYDIEYAPLKLDSEKVIEQYNKEIKHYRELLKVAKTDKAEHEIRANGTKTSTSEKKLKKINDQISKWMNKIDSLEYENQEVQDVFTMYYEKNTLKDDYLDRTDAALIGYFKNGILSQYKSDDIVLRKIARNTILDAFRQAVVWE